MWSEYIWERTDLQYKAFPRALAVSEIAWEEDEKKDWVRFVNDYVSHEKDVLSCLGLVDAGLQYGKLATWNKNELQKDKWVAVEFPVDQALCTNGNIEAIFVHKSGSKTRVKNVKLLFNNAQVASDNHEAIIDENPQNSIFGLATQETCTPENIKIQADMMCEGDTDCEGIAYLYRK